MRRYRKFPAHLQSLSRIATNGLSQTTAECRAEAKDSATDFLRRLVGLPLKTVTGRPNRILAVNPPEVIVATERSPEGQRVPIREVQQALDLLVDNGSIEITPEVVGHRSAFIGAVLLSLPETRVGGSPPVVALAPDDESLPDESYSFEGDLTSVHLTEGRGEQARLRRLLFGGPDVARCAVILWSR